MSTPTVNGAQPSMTDLVTGIVNDMGDLVRQEMRFARKEISSDFRKTTAALTLLIVGGLVLLVGAVLAAVGLAYLLHWAFLPPNNVSERLPLWAAFEIVGVLLLVVGGVTAWMGYAKFQTFNPLPNQTLETIQENVTLAPPHPTTATNASSK